MITAATAKCGNRIHEGPAKHDEIGTAGQGAHHIKTRAHATVDDDRQIAANGRPNTRQLGKRMRGGIELAAAMIGDHQPINAHLYGARCVLGMQDALEQEIAPPLLSDLGKIVPIQRPIQLRADEFSDGHAALAIGIGFHISEARAPVHHGSERPFGMGH